MEADVFLGSKLFSEVVENYDNIISSPAETGEEN